MNWSISENRNDNNEIKEIYFSVYDSKSLNKHRFIFTEHHSVDGKRILVYHDEEKL